MAMNEALETELIAQVKNMEFMLGQMMLMQKDMREDTKALRLEYQNYRKDMDQRLSQLEYWRNDFQTSKFKERLEILEDDKNRLTGGYKTIIIATSALGMLFIDEIKAFFHR